MNHPIPFHFNTAAVRIVTDDNGEPWFCAKDICNILGYGNDSAALAKHCREAGVTKRDLRSGGQDRTLTFINEGNVFRLIVRSKKPAAEQFESWLFEEALPTIRKTGAYGMIPDAVRPGQVEALQRQRLHAELLVARPEWKALARYHAMGTLTLGEMGKLIGKSGEAVRHHLLRMSAAGLIRYTPDPQRAELGRRGHAVAMLGKGGAA